MRVVRNAVLLTLLLLAGCGGESEPAERTTTAAQRTTTAAPEGPAFEQGTVVLETERGEVAVDVEVAETAAQREFGLMYRQSLPRQSGMVFLFDEKTTGGFWMKNTLIPLSIAFFDRDGTILRILDMEPCFEDPCRIYDPGVAYHGALEVNQGSFAEWGVSRGDVVRVRR